MEDFLVRNGSQICLFSLETNNYIRAQSPKEIKANSAHPFLLTDYKAKQKVAFYLHLAHQGGIFICSYLIFLLINFEFLIRKFLVLSLIDICWSHSKNYLNGRRH